MILQGSLLALLAFVDLPFTLLGITLRKLLLLCSMLGRVRLHYLTLTCFAFTQLSLPVCIRLILRLALLLQGLRNARQ